MRISPRLYPGLSPIGTLHCTGTLALEIQQNSTVKPSLLRDRLLSLAGTAARREVVRSACAKLITPPENKVTPQKQKCKQKGENV